MRVVVKALLIFAAINLAYAALNPPVGRFSIYNWLIKGRPRFPFVSTGRHRISVDDIDAIFASHTIAGDKKGADEFRVAVLGDSQTWGWSLYPNELLTSYLNESKLTACGKRLRFYDLAMPMPSVLKDFVYLNAALKYKPDMVVWMVSLSSFVPHSIAAPSRNISPEEGADLLAEYKLTQYRTLLGPRPSLRQDTVIGRRRYLKQLALLQLDGLLWQATGVDHRVTRRVKKDTGMNSQSFQKYAPPQLPLEQFMFDVLPAAQQLLRDAPMIVVNEPIRISGKPDAGARYNSVYPRWAYDQYRAHLEIFTSANHLDYIDNWDAIPEEQFYSQLHYGAKAAKHLAKLLAPDILQAACQ